MNNNPFEPVTTDPNDGNPPLTDNAADDFTANNDENNIDVNTGGTDNAAKAPLSIDGISPNYGDDDTSKVLKIDENGDSTVESATASDDVLTDDHAGDFLNDSLPSDSSDDSVTPSDGNPEPAKDETSTPAVATPPANTKPTKTVKISLLTIILVVLAIAGIAGTVWFYLQNSKNANALAESESKVQQLESDLATNATSENTTANQYDGLSDKIKEGEGTIESLTKDKTDLTKKNEELTKKNTELTTQLTEATKKAADVSGMKTNIDSVKSVLDGICAQNAGFCKPN